MAIIQTRSESPFSQALQGFQAGFNLTQHIQQAKERKEDRELRKALLSSQTELAKEKLAMDRVRFGLDVQQAQQDYEAAQKRLQIQLNEDQRAGELHPNELIKLRHERDLAKQKVETEIIRRKDLNKQISERESTREQNLKKARMDKIRNNLVSIKDTLSFVVKEFPNNPKAGLDAILSSMPEGQLRQWLTAIRPYMDDVTPELNENQTRWKLFKALDETAGEEERGVLYNAIYGILPEESGTEFLELDEQGNVVEGTPRSETAYKASKALGAVMNRRKRTKSLETSFTGTKKQISQAKTLASTLRNAGELDAKKVKALRKRFSNIDLEVESLQALLEEFPDAIPKLFPRPVQALGPIRVKEQVEAENKRMGVGQSDNSSKNKRSPREIYKERYGHYQYYGGY